MADEARESVSGVVQPLSGSEALVADQTVDIRAVVHPLIFPLLEPGVVSGGEVPSENVVFRRIGNGADRFSGERAGVVDAHLFRIFFAPFHRDVQFDAGEEENILPAGEQFLQRAVRRGVIEGSVACPAAEDHRCVNPDSGFVEIAVIALHAFGVEQKHDRLSVFSQPRRIIGPAEHAPEERIALQQLEPSSGVNLMRHI